MKPLRKKKTESFESLKQDLGIGSHLALDIPTSMIISGVESDKYFDITVRQCGIRFVLMSYHYLQKKGKNFLAKRLEEFPDLKVFIDSGAHTFFANRDEYSQKSEEFWEDYLERYTNWVRDNKDYIFACANLDIEGLVGLDKVDEWNGKYFEPLEADTGVQVCYIWHAERGNQGWEEYCKKHSYTGFSGENDINTTQKMMKMLGVAKKYNTRVHGMAMTKTDEMVKIPFFTCDSTTWLVGQQYGELNWFDGRGMKRLSKNEWQRQYKTKLLKEPFLADWDKLINGMGGRGDTYELLRLNVIAYKLAEDYIRKRLGTKMYWLSSNTKVSSSSNSTPTDFNLPSYEWFMGEEYIGLDDYLKQFNISTMDYTVDEAVNILFYFYLFLEDDKEHLDEVEDDDLIGYAQTAIDSSISSREDAIEALSIYFKANASGERTDFIGESGMNIAKDRERYVEEDEFAIVEVSESDITNNLALPAPSSMPEVDVYDEELKKHGIVAVRNSKGQFVKGQQKVRKPKNIYSDKMPKLFCDSCYKSGDCPQYKAGYVCAFDKMFKRFDSRNTQDVMDAMASMVNFNLERMQRAMMFEVMDGGFATQEVTGLVDQNVRLLEKMNNMNNLMPKAIVSQKRVVREDGTEEVVTEMNVSNPQQGGILSAIFGSSSNKEDKEENVVDVDFKAD